MFPFYVINRFFLEFLVYFDTFYKINYQIIIFLILELYTFKESNLLKKLESNFLIKKIFY